MTHRAVTAIRKSLALHRMRPAKPYHARPAGGNSRIDGRGAVSVPAEDRAGLPSSSDLAFDRAGIPLQNER